LVFNDVIKNLKTWKLLTIAALAVLLGADLGLGVFLWQFASRDPESLRSERDRMVLQAKLLRSDVERGEKIRASLPQIGRDCDTFYRDSFLSVSTGYSDIESDLDKIAAQSGVRTSGFSFKERPVKDRGVTEIDISTSLDADYPSIIRFINGIEKSKNFYLLDGLHLATATTAAIRLELELHTYFRT
jgi:hypothetical protein